MRPPDLDPDPDRGRRPAAPTRRRDGLLRMMVMVVWFMVGAACAGGAGDGSAVEDSLTRRERDSLIGGSRLPGAGGVRGAMRAADSAAARAARADSISGNP